MTRPERAAFPTPKVGELLVRLSCRGRDAESVLAELGVAIADAEAASRDLLIVLEDLGHLADSIMLLMKGISRRLAGFPRRVSFWEASGLTEAFLTTMEQSEEFNG